MERLGWLSEFFYDCCRDSLSQTNLFVLTSRRVPEPNIFGDLLRALGQAAHDGDLHRRA